MRVCMVIRTSTAVWVGVSATESTVSDAIPAQLLLFFCIYSAAGGGWDYSRRTAVRVHPFYETEGSYSSQLPQVNLITAKFNYFYHGLCHRLQMQPGYRPDSAGAIVRLHVCFCANN